MTAVFGMEKYLTSPELGILAEEACQKYNARC